MSAAAAVSFAGFRMLSADGPSVCVWPGPWQASQARPRKSVLRFRIHAWMRALGKPVVDVFVTDLAGFRAGVAGRKRWSGRPRRSSSDQLDRIRPTAIASCASIATDYCACTASTANCAPAAWQTVQLSPSESVLARKCDASGLETWHPLQAEAIGCTGLIQPCGSVTGFRASSGRLLLAAVDVAQRAVLQIGGCAGWAHGREQHAGEIVVASAEAHHDVRVLPPSAATFTPSWMRCTSRLKLMPCGGSALSLATVALARVDASVFDGLWHSTQYSVLLRSPPCSDSATWQLLQLLSATTVRRAATGEPSTEKLTTGFLAPSSTALLGGCAGQHRQRHCAPRRRWCRCRLQPAGMAWVKV